MADIFLSYASQDRKRILPLVKAFESDGFSVWWDRNIQAGATYDREIESAIDAAKCVVVVWSKHSVDSEYVRSEVEDAASRDILVPALIDGVRPPLAHRRRQSVNLTDWKNEQDGEYQKLLVGVRATIGASPIAATSTISQSKSLKWRWLGIIAMLLTASLSLLYYQRESVMLALILNAPALFFGDPVEQEIGFTTASDGTRIAYATSGEGLPIVQVLTVSTHLENGQSSPTYDSEGLLALSSRDHLFVRYDGRGSGLSDRDVADFSLRARVSDLEAVVDALGLERFGILAVSAGGQAAIAYTAKHPDRVTRLVLAGALASYEFGDNFEFVISEQMLDLIEVSWEQPEVPAMVAGMLLGDEADGLERKMVGEMLIRANDGRTLASFYRASKQIDVRDEAESISVPTLILHALDDIIIPLEAARSQASMIPGAKLELVEEGGHMASSASTAVTRRRALEFLAEGN